ncbi:hypothetical protein ACOU9P_002558 [Enterococcus faecium]|uniref:hypothetical protein n=1 Tax=Enterococcus faecium TaxID=1352 RepID=UPI000DEA7972|nr:hypothetical protein [Enterococcus faecium]EGP4930068.1 hypothetical protein [Enterococcus faecium]EGP5483128.1 hypothetical protein [Enterococcus faecium]MBD9716620.1 hypothetical protein [Enterococcus faecium]MBD9738474.1 hypothetical protein [Enterococcus faecium]MDW3672297.1 hypothetical protein [Enterococcus faecium]
MKKFLSGVLGVSIILMLGACARSTSSDSESTKDTSEGKFVVSKNIEITEQEKEMNVTERMNELFNAVNKDTIIANTSEKFGYQFAIEENSNEPYKLSDQINKNKELIFKNLDKEIGLENYYTKTALKHIKEEFERMNQHTPFQYPIDFFFLAQYTGKYWGEIKTKDNGYMNANIERNTIVFDGQDWKVKYIDSEGENVAKIEVTNDNIRPTNNSYTFDSSILESKIKDKESDRIAESLQLNDHKYQNMSVIFSNPAINSLELSNIGGKPALVITLNKEDSVWKINNVEYGY